MLIVCGMEICSVNKERDLQKGYLQSGIDNRIHQPIRLIMLKRHTPEKSVRDAIGGMQAGMHVNPNTRPTEIFHSTGARTRRVFLIIKIGICVV